MSEISAIPIKDIQPELPLSVLLFYTAMKQHIALSKFAKDLGVGALSLRQFISGQAQRPRGRTLQLLANALDMSVDEVRYRTTLRLASTIRFNDWIKSRMSEGRLSRARLTRETRISDGALRNYLSGQTLPDTDQAQRLAEIFNFDSLELAKILVADHVVRGGGKTDPTAFGAESALDDMTGYRSGSGQGNVMIAGGEEHVLALWRKLHPHGRRATLNYIATLLAEE